ncbi:hypothetical protein [Actinoallomurus sp. CA-142502]|uniref:hypothetical protein n=1 Tax=Actinoallomurus sp. CA-142502 TaxID=3239885 RepID=UPI003D8D6A11
MTLAQLWPSLIVLTVGLVLVGAAVLMHYLVDEDSDLGCLPIVLAGIGVILIYKGGDALTTVAGR